MRLHAEVTMLDAGKELPRPLLLLASSLTGFMFWSAIIAAVRQICLYAVQA